MAPVLDGNVLVGRQYSEGGSNNGPQVSVFLMVRNGSGFTTAKLAGDYHFAQQSTEVVDYPAAEEPPKAQDFALAVTDFLSTVSKSGAVDIQGTQDVTTHDAAGNPTTSTDQPFGKPGRLAGRSDGSFVSSDFDALGAVSIDGGFVVFMNTKPSGLYQIAFGVRLPPPQALVGTPAAAPK
jgi:hypothetical protein